jgi:TPR repeat protein
MYQNGEGVPRDYAGARLWYQRAIEQREPEPNAY